MINTVGPLDAKIMIVGTAPDANAVRVGQPFQGRFGTVLDQLLSQANIMRYQCLLTYVARERPPADRISLFFEDKKCEIPKPKLQQWIDKLAQEIKMYNPTVIIALGNVPLWVLTGEKAFSNFRGYFIPCTLVSNYKVIGIHSPDTIDNDWKLYFPTVLDLRKALRYMHTSDLNYSKQVFLPNVSAREFIDYMEECIADPSRDRISLDIETVQPGSHIEELGLSHAPDFGISTFLIKGRSAALPENDELKLWQTLARLVDCKKLIMHNAAYDTGVLWYNNKILIKNIYMDTLIAAHVCWPELARDLGFVASICLNVPPWKHLKTGTYNPADAANTFGIAEVLDAELTKQEVRHTFNFEMSLIPIALMMQLNGIPLNEKIREELLNKWVEIRTKMKSELDTILGKEINFNSPNQMQQLLYFDLGLPVQYKRRKSVKEKRTMTTDVNALRTLQRLVPDNPIFNFIMEYKKASTLINSFLSVETSPEGKVHTSYNITGASSDDEEDTKKTKRSFGRWSSSKSIILPYGSGNLQNIPPEARKMHKAPEGYVIIESDYSQAEAVVVAHLINDQKLIKMFNDSFGMAPSRKTDYDVHRLTAAQMFGIPMKSVTQQQRNVGKTIRHAKNYSSGPKVVMNRLGVSMAKAKIYMELYDRANPMLHMWHLTIQQELKRSRTLVNLLGRRHRFLDRWSDSLFRSAYSYIPQSTIGDLLNMAMLRVYNATPDLSYDIILWLQLHDAMYSLVKKEFVMDAIKVIRKCMLIPLEYNNCQFYIDVDFKIKTSWAEGEAVDIDWRNIDGV